MTKQPDAAMARGDQVADAELKWASDQYGLLRMEMTSRVQQREGNERLGIGTSAAIWAWLAVHRDDPVAAFVYWMPAAISVLLGLKAFFIGRGIRDLRRFLLAIETQVKAGDASAWERHLASRRPVYLLLFEIPFWALLSAVNVGLSFLTGTVR